jgi:hypothetical protein
MTPSGTTRCASFMPPSLPPDHHDREYAYASCRARRSAL